MIHEHKREELYTAVHDSINELRLLLDQRSWQATNQDLLNLELAMIRRVYHACTGSNEPGQKGSRYE